MERPCSDPVARFWRHVDFDAVNGCWLWTGATASGYGNFGMKRGGNVAAHRLSWELHHCQPVPRGLHVLHRCDVRRCVNPDHLYVGTHADNMRDQRERLSQPLARRTHCLNGHLFDEENTHRRKSGTRICRACAADAARRYRQRIKVAV